jgi:hypothetical protein
MWKRPSGTTSASELRKPQPFLNLGFLISWKKSELTPSKNFLHLGEHYRTDLGLIFPPKEKICIPLSENSVVPTLSVRNRDTVCRWAITVWNTLVKTRGAVEIPNGSDRNWYTVLSQTKRRHFLKAGAIGMWKYASMRSRLVVFPSLCLTRQTKRSGFFCRRKFSLWSWKEQ